jgi:hypothetical protein
MRTRAMLGCTVAMLLTEALGVAAMAGAASGELGTGSPRGSSAPGGALPRNLNRATLPRNAAAPVPAGAGRVAACPADSWFGQPLAGPNDPWSFYLSEQSAGWKAYDDYSQLAGPLDHVTFFGLSLMETSGALAACNTEPTPTFLVEFYQPGAAPGALVASYTVSTTGVPTGDAYFGFAAYAYTVTLDPPLAGLPDGWISIQGQTATSGDCEFLWGSSLTGDFNALQDTGSGIAPLDPPDNLAFCIHIVYTPILGACCDEAAGTCAENADLINCREADQRFIVGGACGDFMPACGRILGACCYEDGTCALLPQYLCAPKVPGDILRRAD